MQQQAIFELGDLVAGVDEAGRGPLAGPVVAAAVILDPKRPIAGLADSKKLSEARRDALAIDIRGHALSWSVALGSREEIDSINILAATMLAMRRAIAGLDVVPSGVVVDGNRLPDLNFDDRLLPGEAIVGGDAKVASISAASILAKTYRDQLMVELDKLFPVYGFARHKGYGTRAHIEALQRHGACEHHRQSFAPVRDVA